MKFDAPGADCERSNRDTVEVARNSDRDSLNGSHAFLIKDRPAGLEEDAHASRALVNNTENFFGDERLDLRRQGLHGAIRSAPPETIPSVDRAPAIAGAVEPRCDPQGPVLTLDGSKFELCHLGKRRRQVCHRAPSSSEGSLRCRDESHN